MDAHESLSMRLHDKYDQLRREGFDKCWVTDDWPSSIHVGCSQCEPAVINGVATHEHSCPNKKKLREEDHDDDG